MDPATGEGSASGAKKLAALLDTLSDSFVLADTETAAQLRALEGLSSAEILCVRTRGTAAPCLSNWPQPDRDVLAALLMTSGSQGGVKLVQQTHRTLRSMIAATVQHLGLGSDEVAFNWMPVTHVGGLVFLHLLPLCKGYQQVHVATNYIIENPARWIELADRHRATMSWSPNFAFRLIADAELPSGAQPDLSSLRVIANGGEPVSAAVARSFLDKLGPFGLPKTAIRPSFGMSECCSGLTWSRSFNDDVPYDEARKVALGFPIPGTRIRIVDRDGHIARYDETGEVEVAGATLFSGYFENPDLTRTVLRDGWFRTGDAGYVCPDGLVVTGRVKEQLIVAGLKFSPHDIESAAEQCPGVVPSYTAAVAITTPSGEQTALIFAPADGYDPSEVSDRIRMHVLRQVGIRPDHIVAVDPSEVPKTSTGKIRKPELAFRFQARLEAERTARESSRHELRVLPAWFYSTSVRRREITNILADQAAMPLVLVCADAEWARRLSESATGLGGTVHAVPQGQPSMGGSLSADASTPDGAQSPFRDLLRAGIRPRRVACCVRANVGDVEATTPQFCVDLLILLSNIHESMSAVFGPDHHWSLVTVIVDADESSGARSQVAAAASGLLRCIALKSSSVATKCVDVDAASDDIRVIAGELVSRIIEPEILYRASRRFATYLSPRGPDNVAEGGLPWRTGGTYIVTGGLGGIGRILSHYLLQVVEAKVLVIGRGGLDASDAGSKDRLEVLHKLKDSRRGSADLVYRAVDVASRLEVERVVREVTSLWNQGVAGVFHLAGTRAGDSARESFESVLAPKVRGSLILANALEQHTDMSASPFFVHFSSVLAHFGAAGEGAYAAACSFQHALAAARNTRGHVRHYAVGWSAWEGTGMSSESGTAVAARAKGFLPIQPEEGLLSLLTILSHDIRDSFVGLDGNHPAVAAQVADFSIPDRRLGVVVTTKHSASHLSCKDPFGLDVTIELRTVAELPLTHEGSIDRVRLRRQFLSDEEDGNADLALTDTEGRIASIWSAVLGTPVADRNSNFFAIGGDSMKATQAIARIAAGFELHLTVRSLFDDPTLRSFSAEIDRRVARATSRNIPVMHCQGSDSPLSYAQGRLWFLTQLHSPSPAYNIVCAFILKGQLNVVALTSAMRALVERHEGLRSTFVEISSEPRQVIGNCPERVLHVEQDENTLGRSARQVGLDILASELSYIFDLSQGPLFRSRLIPVGKDEHIFCLNMHHIVSDGWSFRVLFDELSELYASHANRIEPALPPLRHRYFDFVEWQRRWLDAIGSEQLTYWKKKLQGLERTRLTPVERSASPRGALLTLYLAKGLVANAEEFCARNDITLFMALLAALGIVMHEHVGARDIAIGTAVANRTLSEWEPLVGFFVNTLVLRLAIDSHTTIAQLIKSIREDATAAYANQDVPFEQVVEAVNPQRSADENPFFSVMMVLQPEVEDFKLNGLSAHRIHHHGNGAKFDILFSFARNGGCLELMIEYDVGLFSEELMRRFHQRISDVLESLCTVEATCQIATFVRHAGRCHDGVASESGVF
jgi:acyl-CoA synthetase (AMP-forming)/AMP-acid ligase II